jgi:2-C-methyl-D-erythritol 2,4-cyclodiphosphate synthase
MDFRVGSGFDAHVLIEGRPLVIGGVSVPYEHGLLGHSDADVLSHAVADALLGAGGLGDIGQRFPDDDDSYKDVSSLLLLKDVAGLLKENNWAVHNIDATIIAQAPKMAPYIGRMRENIGQACGISPAAVNIKATTTERLGFTGREEGIAAQAVALIHRAF